jgi:UDP-2,3-diacylglucosamine pyrophosphatase LpxH
VIKVTGMRALAISDTHFGAWTGQALMQHETALEALAPHLDEIDELILLGDLFDFLFSSVDNAIAQAEPFFDLLEDRLQGKRLVFLAGNHDHHIMVRELRTLVELSVATGEMGMELGDTYCNEHRSFFQRFLDRRLPGIESHMVYPAYVVGDVLLFHGHYLDAHVRNSLPDRLLNRSIWTFAGGRPVDQLTVEDYESVIVPLTEFLFTIAQMPKGTAAQMSFQTELQRIGRLLALTGGVRRLGGEVFRLLRDGRARVPMRSHDVLAQPCDPGSHQSVALRAYTQVVRNLGWDRRFDKLVFAHTHQPLCDVRWRNPDGRTIRFWNTGSWIYEPSLGSVKAYRDYLERAWPGTAILIDTDDSEPQLIHMLAEHNPVNAGGSLRVPEHGVMPQGFDEGRRPVPLARSAAGAM